MASAQVIEHVGSLRVIWLNLLTQLADHFPLLHYATFILRKTEVHPSLARGALLSLEIHDSHNPIRKTWRRFVLRLGHNCRNKWQLQRWQSWLTVFSFASCGWAEIR